MFPIIPNRIMIATTGANRPIARVDQWKSGSTGDGIISRIKRDLIWKSRQMMALISIRPGSEWRYFIRVVCCVLGGFSGILERNMRLVTLTHLVTLDAFRNGLTLRNLWIHLWNDVTIIFTIFCESFFVECIAKLNLGRHFLNTETSVGLYRIVCNMMRILMHLECHLHTTSGLRRTLSLRKSTFGRFNTLNWSHR